MDKTNTKTKMKCILITYLCHSIKILLLHFKSLACSMILNILIGFYFSTKIYTGGAKLFPTKNEKQDKPFIGCEINA